MPTWTEQLPEALRTEANMEVFNKYETIGDFASQFVNINQNVSTLTGEKTTFEGKMKSLNEKMGGMFSIPTEETEESAKKAFYQALGVPENPADYGLDEGTAKTFHSLGITKDQAGKFMEQVKATSDKNANDAKLKVTTALETYNTSLGDKKDVTYKLANDSMNHFYKGDEFKDVRESIMSSPEQIAINAQIGGLLGERPGLFVVNNENTGSGSLYKSMDGIE